ncbi:MAG: alanine--tRNA ligase [Patescibacteria group bacterium]|jgi:alanyl-tRNA synthetase
MTSKEIRQKYLDFFKANDHAVIPSASIMPDNDPTTLFTSSGMQPLVPYLLGEKHPEGKRLTNSQKSFRAEDIEEVGDNRHTTFFEMLGNWSLGDYFKKEQLRWYFTFITEELGIDPGRLYSTVFRGNKEIGINKDSEAVAIWKELFKEKGIEAEDVDFAERDGMRGGRIFYYDERKNWWSRSGIPANMPVGEPGGPDSELFYDLGADLRHHENSPWAEKPCHVNCDCGRFIEIGNSVFMEFKRTENGFEKLAQQNVDFGGGLERTTMVVQGLDNIFETDLFSNILNKISELSGGKKYRENMKEFEVIAEHLRAATFIIGDDKGVGPSNTGQGYIVRRLIRRAIRYGRLLGIGEELWTKEIAKIVAHDYGEAYPELRRNIDFVVSQLKEEEEKFAKTLEKGEKIISASVSPSMSEDESISNEMLKITEINGKFAFNLFQTYGFPVEMTIELTEERGIKTSKNLIAEFNKELEKHQALSRTASAGMFKGGLADVSEETKKLHTAAHLLLAALRKVLGDHVTQKGSNITGERMRFDFSHPEKMTDEQKQEVEKLVNSAILKKLPVTFEEILLEEAKQKGAMGVFESKYGEKVKVYKVGEGADVFSYEICGGPHAENTGELGHFKIQKEESSSAGVRRIKAILD